MAVSIERFANALRVDNPEDEAVRGNLDLWLAAAQDLLNSRAPLAPVAAMDGAIIKLAGYWFDMPSAARGSGFANAMTNSGALAMLGPWVVRRAAGAAQEDIDGMPNGALLAIIREELRGALVWR